MTYKKTFHSCESVDDVLFDLNGDVRVGLGWVVFEVDSEKHRQATGAIGFSNNIFTLKVLQHLNAQRPFRIIGYFTDSTEQSTEGYVLDNIAPLGTLFSDEIGFILFRAALTQAGVNV